ncbi:hypothetical protein HF086_000781 [Spodoptera exigua]|uniref:Ionotropic receptor n=1 Tax=Spodoptera exigua TaxID=7107 RepID=A0A922SL45_SPOEX|nr:hypothetical protein HF086_000781 [Spodoptera exigua]
MKVQNLFKEALLIIMFPILIRSSIFIRTDEDTVRDLTSCVKKILESIDYNKYGNYMDVTFMNINTNVIKLSELYKVRGPRFISRRFHWNPDNISNMVYVITSQDYNELERGFCKVTSDLYWNPTATFIIVMDSNKITDLHYLTKLLHRYNIFHRVSVLLRSHNDYTINRYNFSTPGLCYHLGHLMFWAKCSDFIANKTSPILSRGSIRNCRFTFVTRNMWPFTNFDSKTEGIEQNFITLFKKQFGVKIRLQEFNKVNRFGSAMDNLTIIMKEKVVKDEVEGAVGGYSIDELYFGNISFTYPIMIDHMYYILAHASFVDQWYAVLSQSTSTYIILFLIFVTFCVSATFLSIFQSRSDVSLNVLIVFGYFLNRTAIRRTPTGWPQAIIFSTLLFTALIIPYAIQANLFSVTTQPVRGYEPKEPEELTDYAPVLYSEWQRRIDFQNYTDCGTRLECLFTVRDSPTKTLYTIMSFLHYWFYLPQLTDGHCNVATYALREPYLTVFSTIYLRRGSVLMRPMNMFIMRAGATGIMEKHFADICYRDRLKCRVNRRESPYNPLSTTDFFYVFMLLIFGYCLSTLVFIFEVWVRNRNNNNHHHK